MNDTKVCTKCKGEFLATLEHFRKNKRGKMGLHSYCRKCDREVTKKWREENPHKVKEYTKNYYEENQQLLINKSKTYREENRDKVIQYKAKYIVDNLEIERERKRNDYHKNKEARKAKHKQWLNENKERASERQKEYYKEKPEVFSEIRQRRRSNLNKVEHNFTWVEWEICLNHFENKCCYCGKKKKLEQDHFIPLNSGGEYTSNNIVPACKSCNSSKRDRNFFEWYNQKEYYSKERELKILNYLGYENNIQKLALF